MIKYTGNYFDAGQIHLSGQCFRMSEKKEGHYTVCAGDKYTEIVRCDDGWQFLCSEEAFENFWKHYFALDEDYESYRAKINPKDSYLTAAAGFGSGIRILNQDLWEMIITFLISQQNNIARIRKCIESLCVHYGKQMITADGTVYNAFPTAEALAAASEEDLRGLNLGYRSKYIAKTARDVFEGHFDLEKVRLMPYKEAKTALLELYGVGTKVADCICLFGLHQMSAFPVDTHISQVLDREYKKGFPFRRYSGCQGLMQQYIFYYDFMCPPAKGEKNGKI